MSSTTTMVLVAVRTWIANALAIHMSFCDRLVAVWTWRLVPVHVFYFSFILEVNRKTFKHKLTSKKYINLLNISPTGYKRLQKEMKNRKVSLEYFHGFAGKCSVVEKK